MTRDSSRAAIATCASDRGAQQRAVAGARAGRPHASHEKQARATFVHRRAAIRKDHRARACPFFGAALRASGSGGHGNKSVARTSGSARLGSRVEAKNFEKRERLRRILRGRDSAHPRIEPPFELHELARVTAAGVSAPAFRGVLPAPAGLRDLADGPASVPRRALVAREALAVAPSALRAQRTAPDSVRKHLTLTRATYIFSCILSQKLRSTQSSSSNKTS